MGTFLILILHMFQNSPDVVRGDFERIKGLEYLSKYETTKVRKDSTRTVYYEKLNLYIEHSPIRFSVYNQNIKLHEFESSGLTFMFEVFDKRYLFISIVKGNSLASSPDDFSRDSVYIIDLRKQILKRFNFGERNLTRSKIYLTDGYGAVSAEHIAEYPSYYCYLESVNIKKGRVVIINQALKKELIFSSD